MSDVENAIKWLKGECKSGEVTREQAYSFVDSAVLALEKQTPKRPNYDKDFKIMYCDCGGRILPGQHYCSYCGKAILWETNQ